MIAQGEFVGRRITEPEFALQRRGESAPGQIVPRFAARATGQRGDEKRRGGFENLMQAGALLLLRLGLRRRARQGQPGVLRQPLHRFGERESLRLHQEIENVAVLVCRMVKPRHLLIVDVEGRRALGIERRQTTPFAPRLRQLDATTHHLRHRKARFEVVQE